MATAQKRVNIKSVDTEFSMNRAIIDAISPYQIRFNPLDVEWGDSFCRVIGVLKHPPRVNVAWLAEIAALDGVVMKVHAEPTDSATLVDTLNRTLPELGGRRETGQALERQRAEQAYEDAQTLMRKIDQEAEKVLGVTITLMVFAPDRDELNRRAKRVMGKLGAKRMRGTILMNQQSEAVRHTGPYGTKSESITKNMNTLMLSSTLAASLPFASSGINDGKGCRMGRDASKSMMLIDMWTRGAGRDDRTNVNWTVLGVPGVGKSTAVKHMLLQEWATGTSIIVIDPEREYKDMCDYIGGQWVNAGGGSTIINPLQIKDNMQELEDENSVQMSPMDCHVETLKTFFKLRIQDLSDLDMAYIESAIIETYRAHGIVKNMDFSAVKNEQYPIMEDLYNQLNREADGAETDEKKARLLRLSALMKSMVGDGSNASMWNGHTNVWLNGDFIVFDTHNLQKSNEATMRAQYFNILSNCWQILEENRKKEGRVLLAIDEAYLLVDPKVPDALKYLQQISKRIRKYGGGLVVISHTVNDFLDPEVRRSGEALLENSCYKLLMGADGKNLEEMRRLYNLTDGQCELLASKQRGRGLFIAGSRRAELEIEVTDKELTIFGKGGGK